MSNIIWRAGFFALPLLAINPAFAETFTPPQGCKLEVTVQNRGCVVYQHYSCGKEAEDHQYRIKFDAEGVTDVLVSDLDGAWITVNYPRASFSSKYIEKKGDHPISFSGLQNGGRYEVNFIREITEGFAAGNIIQDTGSAELTGKAITINGKELLEVKYSVTTKIGNVGSETHANGYSFLDAELGRLYGEVTEVSFAPGDVKKFDERPVEVILPGEEGFESINPKYGCGQDLSQNLSNRTGKSYERS